MAFNVMLYKVSAYGASDIGLVRQNNEDSWTHLNDEQFYILADGMGGHQAGEVASRATVENLSALFHKRATVPGKSLVFMKKLLVDLIQEVNAQIYQMGREKEGLKGMGTTLCCILLHPEGLLYAHVGDSRIYRLRHDQLEQLTQDHSLLRELIELGQLNEKQAEGFIYKNIITKAIGIEPFVEPTVRHTAIEVGDVLLMCTDGLTDLLTPEEIKQIILQFPEQESPKQLIKAAKAKGGYDNITVVLVKILDKYESESAHLS